jgi:serine/threonine protein kinase
MLVDRLKAALAARYAIERELGAGGMATVYLARDVKHDRDVALKVLRPDLAAVLGGERFLQEIRISAKLHHPHILTLIDSGADDGLLWYVLPYVRGESLRQKLDRERQLELAEALRITGQVGSALAYAHQQGVIHRDIKPENILLFEGEAMVADFGIALAVRQAGGNRLTETGISLGTPQYMSPEQATGERQLDARSDIYSLAAVLYEMLAGEPPFGGATAQAVVAKLLTERPIRLRVVRPAVPVGVDDAVARALEKAPADRFRSATDFVAALSRAERERPAVRSRRLRVRLGVIGVIAALAVVIGVAVMRRRASPTPFAERQLTFTGKASSPAVSPDGNFVAYFSSNRSLLLQRLTGTDPIVLVPPVRSTSGSPRWSADGSVILFQMMRDSVVNGRPTKASTWMIRSTGGSPREVLRDLAPFDAGSDSLTAVWAQRNPARLEIVELSPFRVRTSIPVPDSLGEIQEVAWSPDRQWLAFAAVNGISVVAATGGEIHRVACFCKSVRWGPGSDALYFLDLSGSNDLLKVAVDRRTGELARTPTRVASVPNTDEFSLSKTGVVVHTQISGSSQVLFGSSQVLAMTLGGPRSGRVVETHALTQGTSSILTPAISADGRWVAYGRWVAGKGSRIEVVPFAGGPARPIAVAGGAQVAPSWSPSGTELAYLSIDSAGARIMLRPYPDGTPEPVGSVMPWIPNTFAAWYVSWSADGAWGLYSVSNARRLSVVNLPRQTEAFITIPDSVGTLYYGTVLSPDGRQLVVSTERQRNSAGELRVTGADGKIWRRVREPFGESAPLRWVRDGWVYLMNNRFLREPSGAWHLDIWRMRISGGDRQFVATLPDGCQYTYGPVISADGSRAVCAVGTSQSDLVVATGLIPESR